MSDPALKVENLGKAFRVPREPGGGARPQADPRRRREGRREFLQVLEDVSFELGRGQALAVIGANGSGKTTLLKILAGVMQPTSGRAEARGRVGALLELGAGFHPELSGIENIYLSGAALGLARRATERYLPEIIEMAELEHFMDMPVKHYSSGMLVRLGFAVASRLEPEIILLDETFAVGDARFQTRAIGKIQELRAAGATLVLVSHNLDLLDALAERTIWLENGRLRADGDTRATIAAYRRASKAAARGSVLPNVGNGAAEGEGARIFAARARRAGGARGADPAQNSGGAIELESADELVLEIEIEIAPGTARETLGVECLFTREDGATLARAFVSLPAPNASNANATAGAARREKIEMTVDPISLAWGEWTIRVRAAEVPEGPPLGGDFDLSETLRIRTPLPYDFRLAATLPARWE